MWEEINLDENQKAQLSKLASLFFNREEIKIILGFGGHLPEAERIYRAARLQAEAEIRQKTIDMAKAGSGPSIDDAFRLIKELRMEELS